MSNDNNNKPSNSTEEQQSMSRRRFLKNSSYTAGGFIGGGLLFSLIPNPFKTEETGSVMDDSTERQFNESRIFFTRKEDFAVLEQATERIYPEDDNGPGAIELGVPYFIDRQLAGDFGSNKKDYMQGPLQEVEDINTYQTLMNRGDVFIEGLRKMNNESKNRHDEKFYNADEDQQIAILTDLEAGDIELEGVRSSIFFKLLRQLTIEGAYADPLYGGNKDMQGWKMREYPGARPGYTDLIESEEFQKLDPISLKDYQP